jgi:hypothetical protein
VSRVIGYASPAARLSALTLASLDDAVGPVTLMDSELRIKAVVPASQFRAGRLLCARHLLELNDAGWCPRCAPNFARRGPSRPERGRAR